MKKFAIWSLALISVASVAIAAAPGKKLASEISTESEADTRTAVAPVATEDATVPIEQNPTVITSDGAPSTASAQGLNYAIDWYSINGGGTVNASSTNYKMGASIGQSVAGAASSASYQMGIGFWYGAGGGCACDCHTDPVCDAVISNVQDVVATIGVAFRGAAAIGDPNGACPFETTDMNCDGFTSVIDVVKVVNVAFRGANPAAEYCVACS